MIRYKNIFQALKEIEDAPSRVQTKERTTTTATTTTTGSSNNYHIISSYADAVNMSASTTAAGAAIASTDTDTHNNRVVSVVELTQNVPKVTPVPSHVCVFD